MKTLKVMLGKLISITCIEKHTLYFHGSNMPKELDHHDLISSLVKPRMSSYTNNVYKYKQN